MHILVTIQDPSFFINADFQGLFNDRENLSSISDACQLQLSAHRAIPLNYFDDQPPQLEVFWDFHDPSMVFGVSTL